MEPTPRVVEAFGGDPAALRPLGGGSGRSWRAGPIVLKAEPRTDLLEWLARLATALAPSTAFRFATPVASDDARWVIDGWAAFEWLDGQHMTGGWDEVLHLSAVFHDALAHLPSSLATLPQPVPSPWTLGDRVAWSEDRPPAANGAAGALLERLAPVLARRWDGEPAQVIHGDMGGNVLFTDDQQLPPAIIDMSPYWRPAAFADAVIVADAIAWQGAPLTLAVRFAATRPKGNELLLRAVAYRVSTAVAAWPDLPARQDAETEAYRPVVTIAGTPA